MKVELPQFKRCCCCIPLRYGLIVWGYFKIIISMLLLLPIGANLYLYILFAQMQAIKVGFDWELVFVLGIFLTLFCDIILAVIYIVAAHKKNYKVLRLYIYYSMYYVGVFLIVFAIFTNICFNSTSDFKEDLHYIVLWSLFGLLTVVLQIYLILLVRSEVIKLKGSCKFRFVNNAAKGEAECTLDIANRISGLDNGTTNAQHQGTNGRISHIA